LSASCRAADAALEILRGYRHPPQLNVTQACIGSRRDDRRRQQNESAQNRRGSFHEIALLQRRQNSALHFSVEFTTAFRLMPL
jgi:hypothetical protein